MKPFRYNYFIYFHLQVIHKLYIEWTYKLEPPYRTISTYRDRPGGPANATYASLNRPSALPFGKTTLGTFVRVAWVIGPELVLQPTSRG